MAFSRRPAEPRAPRARPKTSLKMQAIALLSRREHSRQELRTKLLAALRKGEREDAAFATATAAHAQAVERALRETPANGIDDAFAPREAARASDTSADRRRCVSVDAIGDMGSDKSSHTSGDTDTDEAREAEVDALLDWLAAHGYLSDERFVESRVHARSAKQGTARIRQELARHGLALEPEQAATLRESEFQRAQALWARKFGELADDPRGRAKQARFLVARGFASDVVRRIVGGEDEF